MVNWKIKGKHLDQNIIKKEDDDGQWYEGKDK